MVGNITFYDFSVTLTLCMNCSLLHLSWKESSAI